MPTLIDTRIEGTAWALNLSISAWRRLPTASRRRGRRAAQAPRTRRRRRARRHRSRETRGQHLRRVRDQGIAGRVAARIVHALEPVEVDEYERALRLRAPRHAQGLVREHEETAAITQARQLVRQRKLLHLDAEVLRSCSVLPVARDRRCDREPHHRRQADEGLQHQQRLARPGAAKGTGAARRRGDRDRRQQAHAERDAGRAGTGTQSRPAQARAGRSVELPQPARAAARRRRLPSSRPAA